MYRYQYRYKSTIPLSYVRQGYIFFTSLQYDGMSHKDRAKIERLCKESAGPYWRAVLEFVTTDANATYIENEHHISHATLYRSVKKYYMRFPKKL